MWRCGVSAGFWHARSCGDGDNGSATWAEGTPADIVGLQELPGPIFLVIPLNPSFSPHQDLEEMGKHLTAAALLLPLCLVSLGPFGVLVVWGWSRLCGLLSCCKSWVAAMLLLVLLESPKTFYFYLL